MKMKLYANNLRKLLYWMTERQRIYLKRQAGEPWPWTKDPILQRYKFCNTYREQDKETVWLRENWLEPYTEHHNLWFAVCLYRQINWSPTCAEIGFPEEWNPKKVLKVLQRRKERGEKVYTSAYMIPSHGEKQKSDYTVKRVLNPLWKDVAQTGVRDWLQGIRSLEETHEWLTQYYGFGAFIAYEVVSDLRHTRYLNQAHDIMTWANPGPGAKRGLCRLMDLHPLHPIPKADMLKLMQEVLNWMLCRIPLYILPTLEMRDIEHSLCEYDKYQRATERLQSGKRIGLEVYHPPQVRLV